MEPDILQCPGNKWALKPSTEQLLQICLIGAAEAPKPQCCQGNSPKEGNAGFRSLPPWLPKQVTEDGPQDSSSTIFHLPHFLQAPHNPGTSRQSYGLCLKHLTVVAIYVGVHRNLFSRTQDPKGFIPALTSKNEPRPLHFLKVHTQVSS